MTKQDVYTLDAILGYKEVDNNKIATMENFIKKFIDNKAHICRHCSAQIRYHFQQIQKWAQKNHNMIETARYEGVCMNCGKELQDKRRKYCSEECKKIKKNGTK